MARTAANEVADAEEILTQEEVRPGPPDMMKNICSFLPTISSTSATLIKLRTQQEKVRACQSQIIYNRSEAKTLIEDCYKIECREIRDLVEEELLLKKFVSDTLARERTVCTDDPKK